MYAAPPMSTSAPRVLIADDDRDGTLTLSTVLELEGYRVRAVHGGQDALDAAREFRPDVALLDIGMPEMNGIEVARQAGGISPKTKIVILSMYDDKTHVTQALRVGVAGYLLKGAAVAELPLAIKAVLAGETYLTPKVSRHLVAEFLHDDAKSADPLEGVPQRQREILQLIAEGRSTKEIAAMLEVSVKTIETHRARLMERLDIRDVPGLVRFAIRAGLVSPEN